MRQLVFKMNGQKQHVNYFVNRNNSTHWTFVYNFAFFLEHKLTGHKNIKILIEWYLDKIWFTFLVKSFELYGLNADCHWTHSLYAYKWQQREHSTVKRDIIIQCIHVHKYSKRELCAYGSMPNRTEKKKKKVAYVY